jgi:cation:H+ antiporter
MIAHVFLFLISLVLLYFGAEWLVSGSARIAAHLGVRPLIVGLVIVGFGTSTPELVVSGLASLHGHSQTALGNVIGSNIANSGLILAIAALIRPMKSDLGLLRREGPFMVLLTVAFWAIAWTGVYPRPVGFVSLAALAIFVFFTLRWAGQQQPNIEAEFVEFETAERITASAPLLPHVGLIIAGLALLVGGGELLVNAAVGIARHFGVSEFVIAITVISIGTSVPELATSIVAAVRGQGDIAIGNVIGSNIFNLLGVLGLSVVIHPIEISASVRNFDMLWMVGFALLTIVFLHRGRRLTRWEGSALLASYIVFLISVVRRQPA